MLTAESLEDFSKLLALTKDYLGRGVQGVGVWGGSELLPHYVAPRPGLPTSGPGSQRDRD